MIELLSIDVSNFCSKQCSFCYNHSHREGNTMWKPSEIISFATDCVHNGIKAVSLGGGEPFEYKGIFDVIYALQPIVYLSVTTNGLPLLNEDIYQKLLKHRPDKIHITIHNPDNNDEVERVLKQVERLKQTEIKPGVNLLVTDKNIEFAKSVYSRLMQIIDSSQVILVPMRFHGTPTPKQLASVVGGKPFQSPSCLLGCSRPTAFCSVSWDKKVNSCSYAGGSEHLKTLDYKGMMEAITAVKFRKCQTNPI